MLIAFANKKLEVSPEERDYLLTLKDTFGESAFIGLFETDKNGFITSVSPPASKPIQMIILFYFLNLMLNQRLRRLDGSRLEKLEERIKQLEEKLRESDGNI